MGTYKKTFSLMIVTIMCQVVNLLRDIILARTFGATNINDVYLVSQTIVSVIITMINSPMAMAYVPLATKHYVSGDENTKNEFVSTVYSDILIVATVLMLFEIFAVRGIVSVAAPGFEKESYNLLIKMILIQSPITLISIIKGVNRGNFQILQKFNISEMTNIFPYFCMCIYLLLPIKKDIIAVAVVLSTCTVLSVIPEFVLLYKHGIRIKFKPALTKDIRTMIVLMAAAAIAAGIREVNVLVDKSIGSLLSEGSITMLSYASKLSVVVIGLVSASVSLVGFANTANLKNKGKHKEVLENIVESCNLINFLIIPISVYLIVFSYDLIYVLYYGGGFDLQSVKVTSDLMKLYAIGLIGYGFQDVFTRTLHAYKIVRYTIKESAIMVALNIVLNLCFYQIIGAYGIAIATSISLLAVIPILGIDVRKIVGRFHVRGILKEMIWFYGMSIVTGFAVSILKNVLHNDSIMGLFIESIMCVILYLTLCIVTRNKTFKKIVNGLKN